MKTSEFLASHRLEIVDAAVAAIQRTDLPRYRTAGTIEVRRRLEALFARLEEAVEEPDLRPLASYARRVAEERFEAGYDIAEVQRAFNALEEAIWVRVFAVLEPSDYARTLSAVSSVLGTGKDVLARRYVALATETRVPSVDLPALFAGAQGV